MWTRENRCRYDRRHLRYESDLTEVEWSEVGPLIPPAKPGGNKRTVDIGQVTNGVMYVLSTGCQWRAIPKDLPPRSTVHEYLVRWTYDGTLERLHHSLYVKCREQAGREASPTAAIIDAQSVKSAEKGGASIDPHGYDAGKKVKGKKRHGVRFKVMRSTLSNSTNRWRLSRWRRRNSATRSFGHFSRSTLIFEIDSRR